MRVALARAAEWGVLVCGVMLATSACSPSDCVDRTSAQPRSPAVGDSLVVSLDDVRQITGIDDLASNPNGDDDRPHHPSSEPPGPCRVFDPQVVFGSNWTQFRSAVYSGVAYEPIPGVVEPAPILPGTIGGAASLPPKPLMIGQAVGIYPDGSAARTAFGLLIPALIECSARHAKYYDFTVDQPDQSTVVLNYDFDSKVMYRVKGSALINISALGFPDSERVADKILQNISDRIR